MRWKSFTCMILWFTLIRRIYGASLLQNHNVNTTAQEHTNGFDAIAGVRAFIQDEQAQPRLVNGWEAWPHSWPWQVMLSFATMPTCGGAILSPQWVLTAAHCFKKYSKESYWTVLAGKHAMDIDPEICQQTVNVDKIVTHKDYNSATNEHDIALLKLQTPLSFDECVRPIPVWDGPVPLLKHCTLTGWGTTSEKGPRADRLQEVNITVLEPETCARLYDGAMHPSMMCAGMVTGGMDACQGDSGSPLSCFTGERYEVLGVVSWGVGCGRALKPGIYTIVAAYIQWIESSMYGHLSTKDSWEDSTEQCGQPAEKPCRLDHGPAGLKFSDMGKLKVVNVSEACPHSWPWQVSLQNDGIHYCSGTLIHRQWVLAPRHCRAQAGDVVVLGTHDLGYLENQSIMVKDVHIQAFDGGSTPLQDLSLIQLKSPARLGMTVSLACVPNEELDFDESSACVTTAWGYKSEETDLSADVLYQARVDPLSPEACWDGWGRVFSSPAILCTDAAASSSCMGDYGAPLLCQKNGMYYLVGMLAWGSKRCDPQKPAVFSRVSVFYSWIESFVMDEWS